jgi:aerobic-type carbon monoxide dehydrogenase small subunit (CoxS/CutS family)
MESTITFIVNGQKQSVSTDPDRPLLDVLREDLQLTACKFGCGEKECGACSVLIDGKRVFSCQTAASNVEGRTIRTLEGLAVGEKLHPMQEAFIAAGGFQCGYCTSGMILTAVALLEKNPNPTDAEIVEGMNRNLCRCCGYPKIIDAIRQCAGRDQK